MEIFTSQQGGTFPGSFFLMECLVAFLLQHPLDLSPPVTEGWFWIDLDRESRCSHWTLLGPIFAWTLPKPCQPGDSSRDLFIPKRWRSQTAFERITFPPSQKGFFTSQLVSWFPIYDWLGGKNPPKNCRHFWMYKLVRGYKMWYPFVFLKDVKDFSICFNTSLLFKPIGLLTKDCLDSCLWNSFSVWVTQQTSPHLTHVFFAQKIPIGSPVFFDLTQQKSHVPCAAFGTPKDSLGH